MVHKEIKVQDMEKRDYFIAFKAKALNWFADTPVVNEYHQFFKVFFKKENLSNIEWNDIKKVGDHLHSANSLGIAKKNAFGERPNHSIDHYRKSFLFLAHGLGSPVERLKKFTEDEKYKIKYFGPSMISELAAQVFPEEFVIYNSRSKVALEILGIEVDKVRGDSKVDEFLKFNEIIKPLIEDYKILVGRQTDMPINFEIDQFLSFIYSEYKSDEVADEDLDKMSDWTFAPGEDAEFLEDAKRGLIYIGWDDLGDLKNYSSANAIVEKLGPSANSAKQLNNAKTCFYFANTLKIGDTIYLRRGRSHIVGKAIIESEYFFDDRKKDWKHCRRVKYLSDCDIKTQFKTAITALTPLPEDSDLYLEIVRKMVHFSSGPNFSLDKKYFWLNANPKFWNINEMRVGDFQHYTALNENGQKRRLYDCFEKAQAGDLVVGYSTSPDKQVVCILEVTSPLHNRDGKDVIDFKKVKELGKPVDLIQLQNHPLVKNSIPLNNNQGSLFPLNKEEFEEIIALSEAEAPEEGSALVEEYSFGDLSKEIFLDDDYLKQLLKILDRKKNIVLQGPPGVGKSFIAKRLASCFVGNKDEKKVRFIQFHQSYSYEDFIQGLKPEEGKAQTFKLKNGLFYELCLEAIKNKEEKYVLIIDEVNRGNLSKIFGELLYLVEADKRGPQHQINLAYSKSPDDKFYVPDNIFIIGTMNTADRSLALVDYALRRRFSFFSVAPSFSSKKFQEHMREIGTPEKIVSHLVERMNSLNQLISGNIHELGPGYQIGHSYFQNSKKPVDFSEWFNEVIHFEIGPLLYEYWFNETEKVEKEIEKLKLKI